MRDVTFGQYYPTGSIIHRLDPRIKLVLALILIASVFFAKSYLAYGVIAAFIIFLILLSRVPFFKVLRSLRAILFLMIFTVVFTVLFYDGDEHELLWGWKFIEIYRPALINSSKMALRITFLVLGSSILTLTTTPIELTDALESLLSPLKKIKFPVHELAIIMSITLRLIPNLIEETEKIISAQKARCAEFDSRNIFKKAKALVPVLIPLFISSIRRADDLAYAMDSRCYRGAEGRTRMKIMTLHFRDAIAFLAMLAFCFCILTIRYNFFSFEILDFLTVGW